MTAHNRKPSWTTWYCLDLIEETPSDMQLLPPERRRVSPLGFLGRDLAIDLGAATTQIYARGAGIVLNEPSAAFLTDPGPSLAASHRNGQDTLYGASAYVAQQDVVFGSPPPGVLRSPGGGVLFGAEAVLQGDGVPLWPAREAGELPRRLVKLFLTKVHGHPFARPRLVMALPGAGSPVLREAAKSLAYRADARRVYFVDHAVAVALGAGLAVTEPAGRMVVDIGPRVTRIAIRACGAGIAARTAHTRRAHGGRHRPPRDQDRPPRLRRRHRLPDRPYRRRRRERRHRRPGRPRTRPAGRPGRGGGGQTPRRLILETDRPARHRPRPRPRLAAPAGGVAPRPAAVRGHEGPRP